MTRQRNAVVAIFAVIFATMPAVAQQNAPPALANQGKLVLTLYGF